MIDKVFLILGVIFLVLNGLLTFIFTNIPNNQSTAYSQGFVIGSVISSFVLPLFFLGITLLFKKCRKAEVWTKIFFGLCLFFLITKLSKVANEKASVFKNYSHYKHQLLHIS